MKDYQKLGNIHLLDWPKYHLKAKIAVLDFSGF
jgi:hypothetical protein